MALIRRQLTWDGFKKSFIETMKVTCMVFLLLFGTAIFGQFLAATRIPTSLADFLVRLPLPPVIVLAGILFIYFIGGCFMGGLAFMVLTIPIFFPVVQTLGIDPILFGVLMVIMVEVGSITPPVGTSCYIISGTSDTPLETVFSGAMPFLLPFFICVVLLLLFPPIALFLPGFMR
jgi:TRAP-type C4-dicarboxylate transport system permease large subunit